MDATSMKFCSDTFDLVLDKGTLDAIMCSKDLEIPIKMLQEMFRVTKVNGNVCIISYAKPETRVNLFIEALYGMNYELQCKEIELSMFSDLINCLRSKAPSKKIKDALTNKDVLLDSIYEGIIG